MELVGFWWRIEHSLNEELARLRMSTKLLDEFCSSNHNDAEVVDGMVTIFRVKVHG